MVQNGNLEAPRRQDRPVIIVAEQPLGGVAHDQHILRFGADAAEDAEDRLHEERRLDELAIEEVGERVEMADIVAFEFEAHAVALAEPLQYELDIAEGVAEDEVLRALEMLALPFMGEFLVAREHREEPEIHRAHVERRHLGRHAFGGGEPLVERHALAAAGGDVDDRGGALLDARQEFHEEIG